MRGIVIARLWRLVAGAWRQYRVISPTSGMRMPVDAL